MSKSGMILGHKLSACTGVLLLLAACAVGPDYKPPAPPDVKNYTMADTAALASKSGEPTQYLKMGQSVSAEWWQLFHSQALNDIVQQAIARNQTLAAAKATLAQAQEAINQARSGLYPQINAASSATRQKTSIGGIPLISSLYALGPSVSYNPDVFGLQARQVEQQEALAANQGYQLAAAYLTLTGNAVTQVIAIASTRMQLAAVKAIIADDEKNLDLVRQKFQAGKAAQSDVLTAESQLANDRTQLAPLRQQISVARHALAVLLGKFPAQWAPPKFDLTQFTLPGELPVSLPSELVHQRPDILAAEAQLHAANAAIGVATAQMYPSLNLSAALTTQSLSTNTLFDGSNLLWNLAAGLTVPIFHGGALEAQKKETVEAFNATLATYQQTVLQAFGQVADTLKALAHDADLVDAEKHAVDASNNALSLQRASYAAGKTDVLQLVDAERSYQQALLGYARAEGQRYQDTAQLFVAMGGGWWNAQNNNLMPATTNKSN